jgi:hypothetical protein
VATLSATLTCTMNFVAKTKEIGMTRLAAIALIILALSTFASGTALAQPAEMCPMLHTIQSLRDCVHHAEAVGAIDNIGIASSLLAKLSAAQAAVDRGQPAVATNLLRAFINQVQAQAGVHISQPHADHMVLHATMVIQELGG